MTLKTLTETEERWQKRARRAVEESETWQKCDDCGRFHPDGYEGDCADPENRLPRLPRELLA